MIVGLIPARGGSKRVPRKNIVDCAGRPLIAWTADAALGSSALDRTIVSTDDDEIMRVSERCGLEAPFRRPSDLASDAEPMLPVIQHALDWFRSEAGIQVEALVLLQPTSPLRTAGDIDDAVALFRSTGAETVVSVVEVPHQFHPAKSLRVRDGALAPYGTDQLSMTTPDDADAAYARNGPAVIVVKPDVIDRGALYGTPTVPYVMARDVSVDIDEPFDLWLAERLLERRERVADQPRRRIAT